MKEMRQLSDSHDGKGKRIKRKVFEVWTNPEESQKMKKNSRLKNFRNYCVQDIF